MADIPEGPVNCNEPGRPVCKSLSAMNTMKGLLKRAADISIDTQYDLFQEALNVPKSRMSYCHRTLMSVQSSVNKYIWHGICYQ